MDECRGMTCFVVQIPLSERDGGQVALATSTLRAAQVRMSRRAIPIRLRITRLTAADGHMVCVIEAPAIGDVRDLLALAFLPVGRLREISAVDLSCGQNPPGDLGSGVQS
jgi:hypothetical protein